MVMYPCARDKSDDRQLHTSQVRMVEEGDISYVITSATIYKAKRSDCPLTPPSTL